MKATVSQDICLETLSQQHAQDIFTTLDTHRDELREWLPFVDFTHSVQDSIDFVAYSEQAEKTFAIRFKGLFAGLVGLKDIDNSNQSAEMGYWLSPLYQNKGIVTAACRYLIGYAFAKLNLNRIQIRVAVGNTKSIRVTEKLGARFEGIQREAEKLASGFTDIHVYSILKREYPESLITGSYANH